MAKDPAFLFYPNDYIGGTMGMTFEEKGAYMELLMMQFNRGHMTEHMIGQTIGQIWDKVKDKFSVDEKGLYYNERLEEEQIKRKRFTDSRKNNKKGTNQYTKDKKKRGHMTSHMEDENENENVSIDYNEIKEFFNLTCHELPNIKKITDSRKKAIRLRSKEYDYETIGNVFKKVAESDFLNGKNEKGWAADFDWILKPANFLKILEGNYKNLNNEQRNSKIKQLAEITAKNFGKES